MARLDTDTQDFDTTEVVNFVREIRSRSRFVNGNIIWLAMVTASKTTMLVKPWWHPCCVAMRFANCLPISAPDPLPSAGFPVRL